VPIESVFGAHLDTRSLSPRDARARPQKRRHRRAHRVIAVVTVDQLGNRAGHPLAITALDAMVANIE